jgi:hypothetical protein
MSGEVLPSKPQIHDYNFHYAFNCILTLAVNNGSQNAVVALKDDQRQGKESNHVIYSTHWESSGTRDRDYLASEMGG